MKEDLLKIDLPQILHHTSDLICVVDSELNLVTANRPFQIEFIEDADTPTVKKLSELLHKDDIAIIELHIAQYNEASEDHLPEATIRFKKHDQDVWVSCRIIPEITHFYLFINILNKSPIEGASKLQFSSEFFDKVSVALIVLDRFQKVIQSNKAAQSLLKFKGDDLQGIQFEDLLIEGDKRKAYEKIQKGFERNRSKIPLRIRLLRATGTVLWADISISVVNDTRKGADKYAVISVHDTTRHYRTEQKLAVSQTNLQALFDSSIQAHLLLSTDFKVLAFNKVAEQTTKDIFSQALFVGEDMLDLLPEENKKGFELLLQEALKGKKLLEEEVFRRIDGKGFVWFEMIFLPVYNEDGPNNHIVGLSFSALDISERKKNEEAIARLSMVARKTDNAVVIMNRKGHAEWINSAFTRLTGYQIDEIKETYFTDLIESRYSTKEVVDQINTSITTQDAFQGEIRCQNKYGAIYWADLEITPILNQETGQATHFFATQKDISSLKKQAAKLVHLNRSLESEIGERKKAEENLREKNGELNHFIYRTSHDLRGPIASLLGLHQLVVKDVEDKKAKEYFEIYYGTARNLDKLLGNLTKVTEVRGRDLLIEEVTLSNLIVKVTEKQKALLNHSYSVNFKYKLDEDFIVRSDEGILEIIIQELVRNSIQYQKEEEKSVVSVSIDKYTGAFWKLVTDLSQH